MCMVLIYKVRCQPCIGGIGGGRDCGEALCPQRRFKLTGRVASLPKVRSKVVNACNREPQRISGGTRLPSCESVKVQCMS